MTWRRISVVVLLVVGLALALTACGGGSSSSSSSTTEAESSEPNGGETENAAQESSESSGGAAAAKAVVAPYIGKPSPFPVTEKLKEIPKGATIAYISTGSPFSTLLFQLASQAAQTMGVKLENYKAAGSASEVSAAFDTVVQKEPAAVIVNAITPELWTKQLKELQEKEIPIIPSGVLSAEEYGLEYPQSSNVDDERGGELMANYIVGEMEPEANVVVYDIPEISLTTLIAEKIEEEVPAICPSCSVRTVKIPLATVGNTAANTIVSDLQANPDTNVVAYGAAEIGIGVPSALKKAGIEVETIGYAPGPDNLQYLKEDKETAGLGYDAPVLAWTQIDLAAREIVGQTPTGPEAEGLGVVQFLRPEDITFDPSKGWTGYPDFAERFAKLWGVG
jgi:ribose transport system substrate-binding protein